MRIPLLDTFSAFDRDYNCTIKNVLYNQVAKVNSTATKHAVSPGHLFLNCVLSCPLYIKVLLYCVVQLVKVPIRLNMPKCISCHKTSK